MKQLFLCLSTLTLCGLNAAQTVNTSQQVLSLGLRAANGQGSFRAASYGIDGSLFLLYDQGDGIRLLKADSGGKTILAQIQAGSTGDSGVGLSLDPSGNVYITGTSTSGTLRGTSGAVFPGRADTSTNSFVAKYDANLNSIFLTFLGSGRTAVSSVTATTDAVFVTGITFSPYFPVTASGIQQTPGLNSNENGFVERFSSNGSTLVYATYLTGENGNTVPTAIVADKADNAYITGATSATGYPTINALQPAALGSTSGFLSKLTPAGDGFVYSTLLAGTGLTSMALDATSGSLLLTGNLSLGQFPIATVNMPLTSTNYQTLLRIPLDGQSVTSSVLLVPGSQSYVSPGVNGDAWIAGSLTTPLFPGTAQPDYSLGDSFLLHLTSNSEFDQTLRFGGTPVVNPGYSDLTANLISPAVQGTSVTLAGTLRTTVTSSLVSTQHFYLPQVDAPNGSLLPNTIHDAIPLASSCASQCNGTAALLAVVSTATSAPSLGLSTDDMPNLTLRNMGSASATGLAITASGFSVASNCGSTLLPSSQCSIALNGSGPGSITISSSNATAMTTALGPNALQPNTLALSAYELDYGITTSASPATQTLTVTNLSTSTQTFVSILDGGPSTSATFAESASDCAIGNASGLHILPANSSCHITLSLIVSSATANDGPVKSSWKIGTRDVMLTGFAQAAALSISAREIDFGTHFIAHGVASGINLPRYLYLSNNSNSQISHAAVSLPTGTAFTVIDACPSTLPSRSVCQIKVTYSPSSLPSQDAATLSLDNGLSILLTGKTLPQVSVAGSSTNPSLNVSTTAVSFSTPVIVTQTSSAGQTVSVKNIGTQSFSLSTAISGDFQLISGCPGQLAGGASCILLITLAPSQPGTRLGLLSLTAGTGFAPTYISLSGTATPILPANNGILDLAETFVGEPTVAWYKIQLPLASLSVSTNSSLFGVALVTDTGSGHGLLPASDFASTATGTCNNCWLGIQFLSQTAGLQTGTLSLSTVIGGNAYALTLTGTAVPLGGLLLTPITQDFGVVNVNSATSPSTFTLVNLLTNAAAATIQSVTTTGDFTVTANDTGGASCTGPLIATASCFIQVVFSPIAIGQRTGTLDVMTSAGSVHSTLTGYGTADSGIAISPTKLDFENVPGSNSIQQSVILSNTGTSLLVIGSITTSDPSFTVSSGCTTLSPGSLCNVSVTFTPQAATVAAMLSIPVGQTINGQSTTTTYSVPLTGGYTTSDSGLQILPAEVDFGATSTGLRGTTRLFTINNLSGKQINMTLQMPRQFPLAATSACVTLAPGGSCTFSVNFLPVTNGPLTGTVYAHGLSADGLTNVDALTYMLGYGVGAGALEVNGLPIPYSPVSFGLVSSGQSISHTLTLTNGGSSPLNIRRISSSPPFLSSNTCGSALIGGASCTVSISYAPIYQVGGGAGSSAARSDSDTLIIESDAASSPDMVSLTGLSTPAIINNPINPTQVAAFDLSQSSLTFPNTRIGSSSAAQIVTVTNTGTTTLHVISVIAPADFSASTTCTTLLVGSNCQISVRLAPTSVSASTFRSGALQIISDSGTSLEFVSLIGVSSAAPLTFNPTSLNFGTVNVGSAETYALSVTNTTGAPITFLGYTAGADYSVMRGSCPPIGSTLSGGSSCSLSVTFAPSIAGVQTGTLALTTDATTLPLTIELSGTGVQLLPPSPSFTLSVNGGSAATLTVASGSPAVYSLLLTPISGFTGPVALTCAPVVAATYASCSLLSSSLTLNGSALSSTATINTITTAAVRSGVTASALILGSMLLWRRRRRLARAMIAGAMTGLLLIGCGSSSRAPSTSNIQRTPPGTYQYQVTASSTTGTVVSSSVTLNLIVQ